MKEKVIMWIVFCIIFFGLSILLIIQPHATENKFVSVPTKHLIVIENPKYRIVEPVKKEVKKKEDTKKSLKKLSSRGSSYFSRKDMRINTKITAKMLDKGLKGTKLYGLGKYYVGAGEKYGIDPLVLAGLSANESTWGSSNMARTKNNLFGFAAYDSNTGKALRFSSKKECIYEVARALSKNYVNPKGKYHNGSNLIGVNKKYASDKDWNKKVAQCSMMILKKALAK